MNKSDFVPAETVKEDACDQDNFIPSSTQYFEDLSVAETVLTVICLVLTVLTLVAYVENVYFILYRHRSESLDKRATIWILSVIPVTSVCSAVTLCLPRSALVADLLDSLVFALGLLHFLTELLTYFNNVDRAIKMLQSERIPLASPPLCLFRCCCPDLKLKRGTFKMVALFVLQLLFMQPLTAFISVILSREKVYQPGKIKSSTTFTCILIVRIISTMLGVYGISLVASATKSVDELLDIRPKHVILKAWLVLVNLQGLLFAILESFDIPSCVRRLSSPVRGKALLSIILIIEMTIIALVTRYLYYCYDVIHSLEDGGQDKERNSSAYGDQRTSSCLKTEGPHRDSYLDMETLDSAGPEFSDSSSSITDSSLMSDASDALAGPANKKPVFKKYGSMTIPEQPETNASDNNLEAHQNNCMKTDSGVAECETVLTTPNGLT